MDQGYSGAIQGKELCPSLHPGVVAIEKGAFGSLSIMVANLLYSKNWNQLKIKLIVIYLSEIIKYIEYHQYFDW